MAGGKLAEDTARSRSEALKNAILEASLDCIVTSSAESRVVEWNPAAERTFGFSREEAVGQDLCDLIIPSEQHQAHRAGMARFLATGMGEVIGRRVEVEAIRRNGERFPVELAISTLSLDGQPHFTAYIRDISERVAAAAFLSESRQRLEATYEHAFVGIGEVDAEGRFLRVNQQLSVISGFTREELLQRTLWDITHPDDAVSERELFAEQVAGRLPSYTLEKRYVRKDGAEIWVELSATVVTDAAGKLLYGVRVVRDVTARRKWLEQQRLLINELNHRVKNTLATVQALASQTARSATDPAAAYSLFVDRLTALADAHNILTRESWEGADISDLVQEAIRPFGRQRFDVSGPAVRLAPQRAVALTMAFHELATNATKYGALRVPRGRIELSWNIERADDGQLLKITWQETGGPPVEATRGQGFGTRLLERGLGGELDGHVVMDFQTAGLVCTIQAPLCPPPTQADTTLPNVFEMDLAARSEPVGQR